MASNDKLDITKKELAQLDWITLKRDMDAYLPIETFSEKLSKKFKENPFVPMGALATVMALSYGLWTFRTGERKMSQYMMRTRVVAQGLTIAALITGVIMGTQTVAEKK